MTSSTVASLLTTTTSGCKGLVLNGRNIFKVNGLRSPFPAKKLYSSTNGLSNLLFFSAINAVSAENGFGFGKFFGGSGKSFLSSDNEGLGGGLDDISVPSVVNKDASEPLLSARTLSLS